MVSTAEDRIDGVTTSTAIKPPCVVATVANITLSGLQTIDGVALSAGDRVLVKDQTDSTENGIYCAAASGWSRAPDFDGNRDAVQGTQVRVAQSSGANYTYQLTTANPVVIGSSALTFIAVGSAADSQASVGILLKPRTAAEASAGIDDYVPGNTTQGRIVRPWLDPGDFFRYGAAGDDVINDHDAVQAAFDQNIQSDDDAATIKSGQHTHYIVGSLSLWNDDIRDKVWFASDTKFRWDADTDGIVIGPNVSGEEARGCRILGHMEVENDLDHIASTMQGLEFRNVKRGEFHIGAKKWQNGIALFPNNEGCSYNRFYLGDVTRNNYGIRLRPGGTTGWCNENTFHYGQFGTGGAGETYNWYIFIEATSSTLSSGRPNNNRFVQPAFDMNNADTMSGAYLDEGTYNVLEQPRNEMSGTVTVADIKLAPTSFRCKVYPGYDVSQGFGSSGGDNSRVLDLGVENIVFANDGIHFCQGRSGYASEVIDVKRGRQNTNQLPVIAAHDLYDNSGSPQGFLANLNASRAAAGTQSYGYKVTQSGDLVSTGSSANNDLVYWECIQAHTSASSNEPGVGANWRDYWVSCKTDYINAGAANAWVISTAYAERTDVAQITGQGHFQLGDTSAPKIMPLTVDPTAGAGVVAPLGSIGCRDDGTVYRKSGAGDTAWTTM